MIINQILKWTSRRIGSKTAMNIRFSKLLSHFTQKINFQIIKVAGTNGKGSVSAMLSACLVEDGQGVGLFTSPHLVNITERFRVNETEIEENELEEIAQDVFDWLKDFVAFEGQSFTPSFFEVLILIAIEYFYKKGVTIAIIESRSRW